MLRRQVKVAGFDNSLLSVFGLSFPPPPPQQVEIKMKKTEAIRWEKLEGEDFLPNVKHFSPSPSQYHEATYLLFWNSVGLTIPRSQFLLSSVIPVLVSDQYPSSSHYTRNWDRLVGDIKEEEKNEKLEGDAALNKLFQQIYSDGSDEVKRAMNKSFVSTGLEYKHPSLFCINL